MNFPRLFVSSLDSEVGSLNASFLHASGHLCRAQCPHSQQAVYTDIRLKAFSRVETTGIELAPEDHFVLAVPASQILLLRPRGLHGTMCQPDIFGPVHNLSIQQFVVPGVASMSGLIGSWRPWVYPAWTI